jgi:hypothetical protein
MKLTALNSIHACFPEKITLRSIKVRQEQFDNIVDGNGSVCNLIAILHLAGLNLNTILYDAIIKRQKEIAEKQKKE